MSRKLSFIVPAYNTGDLLSRCLDSILNQTYSDYECIIVDDGSTDNTPLICKEYEERDNRFVCITKKNEGLSIARNIAVEKSTGYYLMFIDSDDYILPSTAELLINSIEKYNANIAMCKYFSSDEIPESTHRIIEYTGKEFCKLVLTDQIGSQLWQYMFKRCQWEGVVSPPGRFAQDMMVLHEVVNTVEKVICIDEYLYYYYQSRSNNTSNSGKNKVKGKFDRAFAFWNRYLFSISYGYIDELNPILKRAVDFSIQALSELEGYSPKFKSDRVFIIHNCRKYLLKILSNKSILLINKLQIFIICISLKLYYYLKKLAKSFVS